MNDDGLREIAKRHARNAVVVPGSRAGDAAALQNITRAEEIIFYALKEADSARVVGIPAGWKLVPVEPTDAMLDAIADEGVDLAKEGWRGGCARFFRIMLAAAPKPDDALNVKSPHDTEMTETRHEAFVAYWKEDGERAAGNFLNDPARMGRHAFYAAWDAAREFFRPPVEPPKMARQEWRPIETAPKGGGAKLVTDPKYVEPPEILLLFKGGERVVGRWDWYYGEGGNGARESKGHGWVEPTSGEILATYYGPPTHWMPLPAAPDSAPEVSRHG